MSKLRRMLDYAYVLPRLGIGNVLAVVRYRRQWKNGTFAQQLPVRRMTEPHSLWEGDAQQAPVLAVSHALRVAILAEGDAIVAGSFRRFGREWVQEGEYPVWCKGVYAESACAHFSQVPLNAVPGEDVKLSWDLSRFHWVPKLALAAAASAGEARLAYLSRLDQLTRHWLAENGFECGVNWSCAQEVSIRAYQLLLATHLLETHLGMKPSAMLLELLGESWKRVEATHAYGNAQKNNHGLTEHLFLIYGAAFLTRHGVQVTSAAKRAKLQAQLPALLDEVILPDGGTVMYSLSYHRVFCDIIAFSKLFDDVSGLQLFASSRVQEKVVGLAAFLAAVIEPKTGKLPWIGNHDGSLHMLQYSDIADAEPSLLLLSAVFDLPVTARAARACDHAWLFGYTPRFVTMTPVAEQVFDTFGLAIFDRPRYRAYVKYPRPDCRPAQADFLHLDLWVDGVNVLSDGGKFSYNAATPNRDDGFSDAMAHNVPTRLDTPILRKLSPFLYAYWPTAKMQREKNEALRLQVPLPDGVVLTRTIECKESSIRLEDYVTGCKEWGMVFHGLVGPVPGQDRQAVIHETHSVSFVNAHHVTCTASAQADNYHSRVPINQLLVVPLQQDLPLTTTITLGSVDRAP